MAPGESIDQKVSDSIPACWRVIEQDTEPQLVSDVVVSGVWVVIADGLCSVISATCVWMGECDLWVCQKLWVGMKTI